MHNIVPIGVMEKSFLPRIRSVGAVESLKDLYGLLSEAKAFERYSNCWDYFPSEFSVADLDNAASEIRRLLKKGIAEDLVIAKGPHCRFVYKALARRQLLQLLKCIHSLRVDMLQCSSVR